MFTTRVKASIRNERHAADWPHQSSCSNNSKMACDGGLRNSAPSRAVHASSIHRCLSHMHVPALKSGPSLPSLTSGLLARDVCSTAPASEAAEPAVGETRHQPLLVYVETAWQQPSYSSWLLVDLGQTVQTMCWLWAVAGHHSSRI